jgi:serine/threonine protein kinase
MKARPQIGLEEKYIIVIARELAEGLKWVHDVGMIHRDIKGKQAYYISSQALGFASTNVVNVPIAANVLISEDGSVQLCDFGVAAMLQTKDEKRQTILGTPNWMAPELHARNTSVLYGKNVSRPSTCCFISRSC